MLGEALVGGAASHAFRLVLDPGGGADQHHARHRVRVFDGELQEVAAAHRVSDPDRSSEPLGEQIRRRREIDGITTVTVTGQIGSCDVGTGQTLAQHIGEGIPAAAGLAEAVQGDDGKHARCVGGHAGRSARRRRTRSKVSASWAPGIDHRPPIT